MNAQVTAIVRPIVVGKSNIVQQASVNGPAMALFPARDLTWLKIADLGMGVGG